MPKRQSERESKPDAGSRRAVRRTSEYITEQWLRQLSCASAAPPKTGARRRKEGGQAKRAPVPKLSVLASVIGLLALAGCGSSSGGTSSSAPAAATSTPTASTPTTSSTPAPVSKGPAQTLSLAANPEGQLKYDKSVLTAKAGKVTITMANMSPVPHDVAVASASGTVLGATPSFQGGSKTLTLNLKAGTYKFYCTVPGHRAAGMEGTLTVS